MAAGARNRATPGGARRDASGVDLDSAAFLAGLQRAVAAMELQGERDLQRLGIRVQNLAREHAPVDTGRLRSSIIHVMGRDRQGPYVDVGTNVKYAPFQEFGTRRQRGKPFLRPALAEATRDPWRR